VNLSSYEKETIILYNQEEKTANVYTHDPKLIAKLRRLAHKYPEQIFEARKEPRGAADYTVPKSCVILHEPYSEALRKAASERAKKAGFKPPSRGASPSQNKGTRLRTRFSRACAEARFLRIAIQERRSLCQK
jgi:hypothetical protein